jgi:hypothetical protein
VLAYWCRRECHGIDWVRHRRGPVAWGSSADPWSMARSQRRGGAGGVATDMSAGDRLTGAATDRGGRDLGRHVGRSRQEWRLAARGFVLREVDNHLVRRHGSRSPRIPRPPPQRPGLACRTCGSASAPQADPLHAVERPDTGLDEPTAGARTELNQVAVATSTRVGPDDRGHPRRDHARRRSRSTPASTGRAIVRLNSVYRNGRGQRALPVRPGGIAPGGAGHRHRHRGSATSRPRGPGIHRRRIAHERGDVCTPSCAGPAPGRLRQHLLLQEMRQTLRGRTGRRAGNGARCRGPPGSPELARAASCATGVGRQRRIHRNAASATS